MPKATLEFNLPEENAEFKTTTQAMSMSGSIHDFYNFLRSKDKHGDYKTEEARKLINEIYIEYMEEMSEFID